MQNMQSRTDTVGAEQYLPAIIMTFVCPDSRCGQMHSTRVPDTRNGNKHLREVVNSLILQGVTDFTFRRLTEEGYTDITDQFLIGMVKAEIAKLLSEIFGGTE